MTDATEEMIRSHRWRCDLLGAPQIAFAAMLLVNAVYLFYKGVFLAPDSLHFYMKGADRLVESGFDFPQFLTASPAFRQYIGFVTWCAILKSLIGDHWPVAIVATNALANATLVCVMTSQLKRLGICWQARAAMIIWCLVAFDLLVWSKGLLSDTTFLLLATSAVVTWARHATGPRRSLILPSMLMILAICWRPTGIALLLPWGICLLMRYVSRLPPVNRGFVLVGSALILEGTFLIFAYYMGNPEAWPLPVGEGHIKYTAHYYDQGQVVWKRYATYHEVPVALLDYHLITLDRLRYWFACFESEFSLAHKAYNVVFYVPLYVGSLWAVKLWVRKELLWNLELDRMVTVLLTSVLAFTAMHAMLQVDYGWRYRVPIIPCLLMLTAIAGNQIICASVWSRRAVDQNVEAPGPDVLSA